MKKLPKENPAQEIQPENDFDLIFKDPTLRTLYTDFLAEKIQLDTLNLQYQIANLKASMIVKEEAPRILPVEEF